MADVEREIHFQTEDGVTIYGTLHLPEQACSDRPVPAALLLHGAAHDRDAFASFVYPGLGQILSSQAVAVLRIDWRGRGQSVADVEYHSFTVEQRSRIYLDVKAALNVLASQPEVDASRLAIVAEEVGSEWAVWGSEGDPRVIALAFISGRLSEQARQRLAERQHVPILCVVSQDDQHGFADMSATAAASKHPDSVIRVYQDMGVGTTMFTVWRYHYPDAIGVGFLAKQGVDTDKIQLVPRDPGDQKPIENIISDWLVARLKSLGRMKEISFKTEDDWTIYGNLRVPENLKPGERAPGIVLLHSGWSDRYIFHRLERLFAQCGIAVLNIDWRGRGKSRDKGNYFKLSREDRDRAYLDAKAALHVLAAQPDVDATKLAILGTYLGAKFAMTAALGDERVRALVMLSGYIPTGQEREAIVQATFPVLFIGSRGLGPVTNAMLDLYELMKDKRSQIIVYDGGAVGYQLFEVDKELEQRIVHWVKECMS
ncbi:MAG: alpha/beta fold hydrolase [Acidobacteriota bacterium]|nr:alpha/beta fold hydrolase [Blastocatellia bacterium]MDW8238314.1 alpha/beta fold hydrolase [Acidobacteriota bacterium]